MKSLFGLGILAYIAAVIFNLALVGGVVWVAVHFIHKFW